MAASTLFYTFLLLHVAVSTSERISNSIVESSKVYVSSWAVQLHSSANDDDARSIASTFGLNYEKILPNNYYLFTDEHTQYHMDKPNKEVTEALESFSKVVWVEQQLVEQFDSRTDFSDPLWESQTHLHKSSRNEIKQRVEEAWDEGYTGKNVTVVVIDNGVRGTHHELFKRYDSSVSVGSSQTAGNHGTNCAGVIAAEANNTLCGVGVAYDCNIGGIQLFVNGSATDVNEAKAFYREHINPSKVDIFSNSWGPSDNGYTIRGPGHVAAKALKFGVQKGRGGLGNIYVFSCGNGWRLEDSCAFDGYVNSIYTIPVASIKKNGKLTTFSEPCSAIMTAVYSTAMVTISSKNNTDCVSNFGRTSAAGAFVSGILALALEANRNLTWRDMQHLIARSSTWKDVHPDVKRVTNAKKFTVNENFGFGILDALALVKNAKKWNVSVPDQVICTMNAIRSPRRIPTKISVTITEENLNCETKLIRSLEHVQLKLDLEYQNRAVVVVDVKSKSGTPSRFVYPRRYDGIHSPTTYSNLVVTSVHFWGESLLGTWTVDIKEGDGIHNIGGSGTLSNLTFTFYGTHDLLNYDNKTDGDDEGNKKGDDDSDGNSNDDDSDDDDDDNDDDDDDDDYDYDYVNDDDDDVNYVNEGNKKDSNKGAIIAGSVVAAFVLLVVIGVVAYKLKQRSNRSARQSDPKREQEQLPNRNKSSRMV